MLNSLLSEIKITDTDVDEIEGIFSDVIFDEQRRNIIKNMNSVDIQAFPGTGKTTVLIAKLAILAKKWSFANKGICVLSHTNVAREEIETRLGNTSIGKKLLSYPHFIGTVHSFFDTFVSLPWLRSHGYPITLIDTDIVLNKRWNDLQCGTKMYLEKKKLDKYACEAKSFPIKINIGCKETASSYIDTLNVIKKSFDAGYYTFNEILFIAKHAIDSCAYLPYAIQNRFPILFIDEAQDTDEFQWKLINNSFHNSISIRQVFGDANQAIFNSYFSNDGNTSFPSTEFLTISDSHRFGNCIARLVDHLGVEVLGLKGDFKKYENLNNKHSIFLFDKTENVLPTYSEFLLSCFSDKELNDSLPCYAVGMVHNKEQTEKSNHKYPVGIKDYWKLYEPKVSDSYSKPRLFIDYFRRGKILFEQSGDYYQFIENIAEGFRKYIHFQKGAIILNSGNAINALFKIIPDSQSVMLRSDFRQLISFSIDTEELWNDVIPFVLKMLETYFGVHSEVKDYFLWHPDIVKQNEDVSNVPMQNVYIYHSPKNGRRVQIHLSSIHGEKGKTHLATLVLDTFWHSRNIKSIIPWLCNKAKNKPNSYNNMRLKCHYVALTRARGLICIAIPKNSISSDEKNSLKEFGWNIIEI